MTLSDFVNMLIFMSVPLLVTTGLLAIHAYVSWRQTMDKILRGMKVKEVRERVEVAAKHRKWARYHAIALSIGVVAVIVYSAVFPPSYGDFYRPFFDDFSLPVILWTYCLFFPHMLGLLLYHIRWNPNTLARKQKLDAEDAIYEGNFELDADKQYGVNEEGELIELAMQDDLQQMQS